MSTEAKRTRYQTGETVTVHRSELKNAVYNPRRIKPHARNKLKASLKRFKLAGPLLWNRTTGNIVGGHQRVSLIDELEGTDDYSIDVTAVELSETEEMALNIQLNNPNSQGEFDDERLGEVAAMIIDADFNIEATGFTTNDLVNICGEELFADGIIGDQIAAETEDVDLMHEIREVSKFTADPKPAVARGPVATDGREDEFDDDEADDTPHGRYQASEEHVATEGTSDEWKDYDFKARRRDAAERRNEDESLEPIVTLVFESGEQAHAFERHVGLEVGKAAYDVFEIEAAFGVKLVRIDGENDE
ncbi:hypothetical protein [Kordiimonas sp.]|uniref:hypothetical protein n=1 Tax=Kordiimonas sp. TaxID=1970157 RepID=UPI003A958BF5